MRAEEDRAFAAAKRANTALALETFLAAYPAGACAREAQKLKTILTAREDGYRRATAANDPAALRSFIATYRSGADVDVVKRQLRALEPQRARLSGPVGIGVLTLLLLLVAGGAWFWLEQRPVAPLKPQLSEAAAPAPAVPSPSVAITLPQPDQVAWELFKDTTDESALKRFAEQYPDSSLRKDAETRIALLEAAQAKKPAAPEPDQIAWAIVQDSKDPDQLRRFIAQFPDSSLRADAEKRLAAVLAEAAKSAPNSATIDPTDLARLLQLELIRVGCLSG